jgi:hypothetical protein
VVISTQQMKYLAIAKPEAYCDSPITGWAAVDTVGVVDVHRGEPPPAVIAER